MNPFSGNYMFNTPSDSSTVFAILIAGFGLLFLVSAFAYWRRAKLARNNPPLKTRIRRMAAAGMWCAGIGLFLALMRYLQIDYVSMPILTYLLLLTIVAVVAYFVYDFSERYPLAVWRLEEASLERRYRPAARPRVEPQRPRPKVRGKRRR